MGKGAIILELDSSHVTLLTEGGAFLRLPTRRLPRASSVGQHVDLAELKSSPCLRWLPVAAACLIIALLIPILLPAPAHAWVSLDGSSSLEVQLDKSFRVMKVEALNDAGRQFMEALSPGGEEFSALVANYLEWSSKRGDDKVLITSTASRDRVNEVVKQTSKTVDVIVLEVSPKAREEAGRLGLSTGRALLAAGADGQGIDISPQQIKDGNPFATLTAFGADVEKAVSSSSDPSTQADKIRELPNPDPADGSFHQDNSPAAGQAGKSAAPGQVGKETPPGQAAKAISRGKTYAPPGQMGKEAPPGQVAKAISSGSTNAPPGQGDKELPPGLAKKSPLLANSGAKKLGLQPKDTKASTDEDRTVVSGNNGNGNNGNSDSGNKGNNGNGNKDNNGNGSKGNNDNKSNGNKGNNGNQGRGNKKP